MEHDFFDGVQQVNVECIGKPIKFPLFYRDVRSFTGAFPANWFKLRRMLPDWRYVPAQVFPGVGAVTFTPLNTMTPMSGHTTSSPSASSSIHPISHRYPAITC